MTAVYYEGATVALKEEVDSAGIAAEILPLIPTYKDRVHEGASPAAKLQGVVKSREKRVADAAARKAKATQAA